MEYVIGATLTLITVAVCNILLRKNVSRSIKVNVNSSQSRTYQLMRPLVFFEDLLSSKLEPRMPTQSSRHHDKVHVKVIISDTEAYWIANSKFYVAEVKDEMIVQETTREVDTMAMDDVQLKKIIDIVDMLGEENDRGSSGNKDIR